MSLPHAAPLSWIDCGRFGYLPDEQVLPHWLTLPASAVAAPALLTKASPVPVLQEITLARLRAHLGAGLDDAMTARPSARLTDRLSRGASTRFTTVDDSPTTAPVWPVVPIADPADLESLLAIHDAAWTGFERSGAALVLRIEPPAPALPTTAANIPDIFHWLPVVERFFARHATLPVLLDDMGPTEFKGWDQLIRLGSDAQVYGLARGIPGLAPDRRGVPVEQLTALELRRADAILHFYVGEAGAERVLFGSGLGRRLPVDEGQIHAQAQWFARERPWLDTLSAQLILRGNAKRLAQA